CVPDRNGEYTGMSTNDDVDGDGVSNDADNCQTIFNPVRPMDGMMQPDGDQDGVGDACDPCPTDPTDTCMVPLPGDIDADGVLDVDDNCISEANPTQDDMDSDGIGDACDVCPTEPNPGGTACPASVYDIKDGTVPIGSNVSISDIVVTGS